MQDQRADLKLHTALPVGGAGFVLLLITLFRTGGLSQGDSADKLAVLLLVGGIAVLALILLALEGCSPALVWALLLPVSLALFFRVLALDHITYDYQDFLAKWASAFREGGGFAAVKENIGNYNAPYLYFLAAISYWKVPDLYLIKLFSVLFDMLLAWGGLRLCRVFSKEDSLRPAASFCLLLLLPTVILNGSYWAQCDSIYGALVLHALASALSKKPVSSLILLAAAFSFKLQTVFIIPLWCVLWFSGRIKFRHLLLFPAAYAVTVAPALLLGKPLADTLGVYAEQTGTYVSSLTYNAPSVFAFIPYKMPVNIRPFAIFGIAAAFLLVFLVFARLFPKRKKLSDRTILSAAVVLAAGIPFLLPYMHERYFFLAEALTVVWACVDLNRFFSAAAVQVASLGGYYAYLRLKYLFIPNIGRYRFPLGAEALLILIVLIISFAVMIRERDAKPAASGKESYHGGDFSL